MNTRTAPILVMAFLLLAALVPLAGAQSSGRPTPPPPELIRTVPNSADPAANSGQNDLNAPSAAAGVDTTVLRASTSDQGLGGNGNSYSPDMTPDGRFVAFHSDADNLVTYDWNEATDVFVRDTQTNTIERVSVNSAGDEANGNSLGPAISDDGRYVAFQSAADNLVAGDANNAVPDVFVHDRLTNTTTLVSRHTNGTQSVFESGESSISGNGQRIAFSSSSGNLVDGDNNYLTDIFVHDLSGGTTTLVSLTSGGAQGNNASLSPAISANGQFVAFTSYASNLAAGDSNDLGDVFIRNLNTNVTTLVSQTPGGVTGNRISLLPAISADGQVVAFTSYATDLVAGDTNGHLDIFVRDLGSNTTSRVSLSTGGDQGNNFSGSAAISDNGQIVAFDSNATNLVDDDLNGVSDVFLHNRGSGETTLASRSALFEPGDDLSSQAALSADGAIVAFHSAASNLVAPDIDVTDVFVRYTDVALNYVSGTTYDDNSTPLPGILVRDSSGAVTNSDNNGDYTLSGLLAGNHKLWFEDPSAVVIFEDLPVPVELPTGFNILIFGIANPFQQLAFEAQADAYVDQAKPTTNFGTKTVLNVKNASSDMNAHLRFNVDVPDCAQTVSPVLDLYTREGGPDGGTVYSTTGSWTETGIKWNTGLTVGASVGQFGSVVTGNFVQAPLNNFDGDGQYSYMIRSNSSNPVQYDSRETVATYPLLFVYARPMQQNYWPDAQYDMDVAEGVAPLEVQFTDMTEGCVTQWEWDFGDGTTSTEQNPSHTYTVPDRYNVSLTVSNGVGEDRKTKELLVFPPPPSPSVFDISPATSGTVQGIPFTNADILRYNKTFNTWTMIYDGSVRGTPKNISSFAWDGNDLLIGFSANQAIAGLGTATAFDIVRFQPNVPGLFPLGPGTYSWAFKGKDHTLTTLAEKIDAFGLSSLGDWYISTTGAATVTRPGGTVKAADEDALIWQHGGQVWDSSLRLDGSTVPGLAVEDVNGLSHINGTDELYITILGAFNLGGVTGNGKSIIRLEPSGGGYNVQSVQWLAPGASFPANLDAIEVPPSGSGD